MRYRRLSRRRAAFVAHFLRNGGNGTQAAISAGFSPSSAGVTASSALRDDQVLALIAAEVCRRGPAADAPREKLLAPTRPEHLRVRFQMLLAGQGTAVKLIGTSGSPLVVVNAADAAMRDHVVRHAADLGIPPSGAKSRCQVGATTSKPQQPCVSERPGHRSTDAVHTERGLK